MKPLDAIKLCTLLLKLQLHPVGEMNGSVSLQTKSARGGVDRNSEVWQLAVPLHPPSFGWSIADHTSFYEQHEAPQMGASTFGNEK